MKARQPEGLTISFGPSGSLESRTATTPRRLEATSTQLPPLLLKVLLRQMARDRSLSSSAIVHPLFGRHGQASSAAAAVIRLTDSSGPSALATRWLNMAWYRSTSGSF